MPCVSAAKSMMTRTTLFRPAVRGPSLGEYSRQRR
jgi:hypothetical protein